MNSTFFYYYCYYYYLHPHIMCHRQMTSVQRFLKFIYLYNSKSAVSTFGPSLKILQKGQQRSMIAAFIHVGISGLSNKYAGKNLSLDFKFDNQINP